MKTLYLLFLTSCLISVNSLYAHESIEELINASDNAYDSDPEKSFSLLEEASAEADKTNNHQFDGEIYLGKGRYHLLITKYDLATTELNTAISLFKKSGDKVNLANAYSLKSILHGRMGEPQESHLLLLKVVNLNREVKDTTSLIGNLFNLSLDYLSIGELDSMKITLDELNEYTYLITERNYYFYHQNWGTYYTEVKQYDTALKHYHQAKEVADNLDMLDSRATILVLLSKAYRLEGLLNEAEKYAGESYKLSNDNNLLYELDEALEEMILIKENLKRYDEAFYLQQELMGVKGEILSLEKIQKVKAIEGQLKIAEKEKLITEGEIALQAEKLEGEKTKTKNTWLFSAVIIVLLLMVFTVFIYLKTKRLNVTIQSQKKEVEIKSSSLELALKSINDSIEYSKRIQNAILPPLRVVKEHLKDSFILYKPKDIVAGDFYWMENRDGKTLFAAADCTGHGVPGAMVSVVCNNALNRSVREHGFTNPADILNKAREIVIEEFEKSDEEVKDGMDIALCSIEGMTLEYAGAHNPLWIIRNGELIETKGDKQPIGKFFNQTSFNSHTFQLEKNDLIYIFSDGYADQFGGENGKKFKVKAFKKLLLNIQDKNMDEQKEHIDNHFESWKGDLEQLDDVCVIGVKI